jgi:hypothetical protein
MDLRAAVVVVTCAFQAGRVLAPPLYRFGLSRATRGTIRPTDISPSGEG